MFLKLLLCIEYFITCISVSEREAERKMLHVGKCMCGLSLWVFQHLICRVWSGDLWWNGPLQSVMGITAAWRGRLHLLPMWSSNWMVNCIEGKAFLWGLWERIDCLRRAYIRDPEFNSNHPHAPSPVSSQEVSCLCDCWQRSRSQFSLLTRDKSGPLSSIEWG